MKPLGIAGIQKQDENRHQLRILGDTLAAQQLEELEKNLIVFKKNLEDFALKYASDIKKNAKFRVQFHKMCALVGVDPLQSSKGYWTELLGVGDFYYELSVQIMDICVRTRSENGGLLEMQDLLSRLRRLRSKQLDIEEDDVIRAVKLLEPLGGGTSIVQTPPDTKGGRAKVFVQSVPHEFGQDMIKVIQISEMNSNCVSVALLADNAVHKFSKERAQIVLDTLLSEGVCWIDTQSRPPSYYMPTLLSTV